METEVQKLLKEIDEEDLIELFAPCMDDYLYIIDLQKDTCNISQSAVKRFMMENNSFSDALNGCLRLVYEDDRPLFAEHYQSIIEGKEKNHNIRYRWLDKDEMPVWINCRGKVIDDKDGAPHYLVGCVNEIGNTQKAHNISGLLGESEMHSYISANIRDSSSLFLMHIGIDSFNAINGMLGVEYGDYVLKSVADCIKECLSDGQRLYHMVADEYMIVDEKSRTKEEVMLLHKEIQNRIEDFIISEKYKVVFTISTGIIPAKLLLKYYDEYRKIAVFSLKQAKSLGGNGTYFFDIKDYESFLRKEKIKSVLRNAVANDFEGFEAYYQPIVDCSSGKVIGAEALMRFFMDSEDGRENISPMEFIPLLEETGLIIPAGRYVLNEAAEMCSEMQQYIPGFKMNVNVSYVQIIQGKVEHDILTAIRNNSLKPESICIEMTESGFMDMTPSFCRFRKTLDDNNINFVIDDFGTGYSNFHCIRDMNPSYVKMDKDFTAKAMNDARDNELYRNIIPLVHSIDVRICAEGIEERDWYLKMKEMQVDYLQGYYFGRPCRKEQFIQQYTAVSE